MRTLGFFANRLFVIVLAIMVARPCWAGSEDTAFTKTLNAYLNGDDKHLPHLLENQEKTLVSFRGTTATQKEIMIHLVNLGADKFKIRRAATEALIKIGQPAHPFVRKFLGDFGDDPEIRERCTAILAVPQPKKNTNAALQRVKFFIACKDLPKSVLQRHATDYFAVLAAYKPGGLPKQKQAVFLDQCALIEGSYDALANKVHKFGGGMSHEAIVKRLYTLSFDKAVKDLIKSDEHLATNLRVLLENHADDLSGTQRKNILKTLVAVPPTERAMALRCGPLYMKAFKDNHMDFLNSDHPQLQQLGLAMHTGSWKPIRTRISTLVSATAPAGSGESGGILKSLIKIPKDDRAWLAALLAKHPNHKANEAIIALLASAPKLPVNALLDTIKSATVFPNRMHWVKGLLENKVVEHNQLSEVLYESLENAKTLKDAEAMVTSTFDNFSIPVKEGALDDLWTRLRQTNKKTYTDLFLKAAARWKVTPALVLPVLQASLASDEFKDIKVPTEAFIYLMSSNDTAITEPVLDMVLKTLREPPPKRTYSKWVYLKKAAIYQKILELRPELETFVLDKMLEWYEGGHSELTLYYCMLRSGGNHTETFTNMASFILNNQDRFCKRLATIFPENKDFLRWFPVVSVLAGDSRCRAKHAKLLTLRLEQMLPLVSRPEDRLSGIIAARALGYYGKCVTDALVTIAQQPPRHYFRELLCLMDERYADALPALMKAKDKQSCLEAALRINPSYEPALRVLREQFLKGNDQSKALWAGSWLAYTKNLPELKTLSKTRFSFLFKLTKDTEWSLSTFVSALDRPADKRLVLLNLKPKFAEHLCSEVDLSDLTWQVPDNQKIIMEEVLAVLETGGVKERKAAANILASMNDEAVHQVQRIHACLKKESDDDVILNLLWAISNIGPAASDMEETVRNVRNSKKPNRMLFCLANVSAKSEDRRTALETMITDYRRIAGQPRKDPEALIRMIGLVRGQPDVTQPFMLELLDKAGRRVAEGKKPPVYKREVPQIIWALGRDEPSDTVYNALITYLKRGAKDHIHINEDTMNPALWELVDSYADRIDDWWPHVKNLPIRMRINYAYWEANRLVREIPGR